MIRFPPKLPLLGRNKGLHAWLNRLLEAVQATQIQVPHGVRRIQGGQGVLLEGNFGAGNGEEEESDVPRWG